MFKINGLLLIALVTTALVACRSSSRPVVADTNSNWLKACDSSKACGEKLSCICGVCTVECNRQSVCEAYDANATCISALQTPLKESCQSDSGDESIQVCVLSCRSDGDCSSLGDDTDCVDGQCVNQGPLITIDDGAPTSCNPLDEIAQPLRLGDLIIAAKDSQTEDSQGTIYAAYETDDDSGDYLLFVSEGEILYRKHISGFAGNRDSESVSYHFSVEEEESNGFTLLVTIPAEGNPAAALALDSDYDRSIDSIENNGESLEVLDPEIVTGKILEVLDPEEVDKMEKRNLPGIIAIEYLAKVEDGKTILVTRPEYDWSYEDFKLYYGTAKEMKQLVVLEVLRARDGGSTWITFEIGSSTAEVAFPVHLTEEGIEYEPATLTIDDQQYAVTRSEPDTVNLSKYNFVCDD